MGAAGYWWERLCFMSYAPFLVYTAAVNPFYFGHMTYWALSLHALYFTIDKASPHSARMTLVLHGMSFGMTFMVFMGYTNIMICGLFRFGSYLKWENAIGKRANTVHHDRGLQACPSPTIDTTIEHSRACTSSDNIRHAPRAMRRRRGLAGAHHSEVV